LVEICSCVWYYTKYTKCTCIALDRGMQAVNLNDGTIKEQLKS